MPSYMMYFAQAEHDELARTYVISEDAQVLKDLESRIAKALPNVDRYDIVSKSIANQHDLIHASNFDEACHVMNTIAPETCVDSNSKSSTIY